MIKITREQADQLMRRELLEQKYLGKQAGLKACICYRGQWYDVRGKTEKEVETFIMSLLQTNPLFVGETI